MKTSPWSEYYRNSTETKPTETLVFGEKLIKDKTKKLALDIGSGTGNDTLYLLEKGFNVIALDQEKNALDILKDRSSRKYRHKLVLEENQIQNYTITRNTFDLINASYSLPFCNKKDFLKVWKNIYNGLKSNGIFSGQIFGINDDWSSIKEMSFFTNEEIDDLIIDYIPEYYIEEDEKGLIADGSEKHWHLFNIVIRKL